MRRLAGLALVLALAGCETLRQPQPPACPAGQEYLSTAQLFLGRKAAPPYLTDADLRAFVEAEVTPRFPDGVTLMDGGGDWSGSENRLIREAQKVVLIVLPERGASARLAEVRAAFKARHGADSVVVTQGACVAL